MKLERTLGEVMNIYIDQYVDWNGEQWQVINFGTKAATLRSVKDGEFVHHIPVARLVCSFCDVSGKTRATTHRCIYCQENDPR